MHVQLGNYAPTVAPARQFTPSKAGASVVPNTVPMSLTPQIPTAEMGHKSGKTCHMHRMGKAGMRCRCNNKLAKKSRC